MSKFDLVNSIVGMITQILLVIAIIFMMVCEFKIVNRVRNTDTETTQTSEVSEVPESILLLV